MVVQETMSLFGSALMFDIAIFVLLFLIGYGTLILSRKYHLPEPLILFVIGMMAHVLVPGITAGWIVIIALVLLLFDAGAHFLPRKFDAHSVLVLEFILYSFVANTILSGVLLYAFLVHGFTVQLVLLAIVMGALLTACSQFEILKVFKVHINRLYRLTQLEDHLSNPLMLTISLIALWFASSYALGIDVALVAVLSALFIDIAVGIFFAIIVLALSRKFLRKLPLAYISAPVALLTYYQAYLFGGTGFIAVLVTSLFYHNTVSRVSDLGEFGPFLSNAVYILVFILLGYMIPITFAGLYIGFMLFMLYLSIRYILLGFFFHADQHFMTLDCPKGLAVGAVILLVVVGEVSPFAGFPALHVAISSLVVAYVLSIASSYSVNVITHKIIK
ncbi:MAG: hypothetical protein ACMXYE_02580 [Candidatus Woesearchaeota archaeon]